MCLNGVREKACLPHSLIREEIQAASNLTAAPAGLKI